jgi:hypothetical protein
LTGRRSIFQRTGRVFEKTLATPEGDVKLSGDILLGDVNVENKELWPELKDET